MNQDEMRFAIETSRAVLWTEYARNAQNRMPSGYEAKKLSKFTVRSLPTLSSLEFG